ncbi:MAG: fumarylacetoacetate hydrolase family protein [Nitrososphaerota archaeon]
MRIVRFYSHRLGPRLGVVNGEEVIDITRIGGRRINSFLQLLKIASKKGLTISEYLENKMKNNAAKSYLYSELDIRPSNSKSHLLIPIIPPEVWGAGVTYLRSKDAREYETRAKGVYDQVYDAERPEIFLKATRNRCVGPNQDVYIRSDSNWTVPEPELALVLGPNLEIAGYTVGNDVSARDIEGENPLYCPQAKIYKNACAIGPAILTADSVDNPRNLKIEMRIFRDGNLVFQGETNTGMMKRTFEELREYLLRDNPIPPGTVFMTGTGIVPPDDFSLQNNDIIEITIEKIGTLRNRAVKNHLRSV